MTQPYFTPWHQYIADQCAVSSKLILDRREPIGFHADLIRPIAEPVQAKRVEVTPALTPEQCREWGLI